MRWFPKQVLSRWLHLAITTIRTSNGHVENRHTRANGTHIITAQENPVTVIRAVAPFTEVVKLNGTVSIVIEGQRSNLTRSPSYTARRPLERWPKDSPGET